MAIAALFGYQFKSIQDVKASFCVFPVLPMLAIALVYRNQYLSVHSPLSHSVVLNFGITIMEVFF